MAELLLCKFCAARALSGCLDVAATQHLQGHQVASATPLLLLLLLLILLLWIFFIGVMDQDLSIILCFQFMVKRDPKVHELPRLPRLKKLNSMTPEEPHKSLKKTLMIKKGKKRTSLWMWWFLDGCGDLRAPLRPHDRISFLSCTRWSSVLMGSLAMPRTLMFWPGS